MISRNVSGLDFGPNTDMPQDFPSPSTIDKALKETGEAADELL